MIFQAVGKKGNPAIAFFHAMGVTGESSRPVAASSLLSKGIKEGCKSAEYVVAAFGLKMERPQELKPAVFTFFVLYFTLCAILESKCYSLIGVVRSLHQNTSSTAHTAQITPPIMLTML